MKRRCLILVLCLCVFFLVFLLFFPAQTPNSVTGTWYATFDESQFDFSGGLIFSDQHYLELSDGQRFSGAYCCGKNRIFLFAVEIPGLESEKELYLVKTPQGDHLCEDPQGKGQTYFHRPPKSDP